MGLPREKIGKVTEQGTSLSSTYIQGWEEEEKLKAKLSEKN